jgi:hypothetical protein
MLALTGMDLKAAREMAAGRVEDVLEAPAPAT